MPVETDMTAGQVVMFATAAGSSPYYAKGLAQAGFGEQTREIQERVAKGDMHGALAAVSNEMADAFTLAGSGENVRHRIAEYHAACVNTVCLNPSPPSVYFPLFQGHLPDGVELPSFSFPEYLRVVNECVNLFVTETRAAEISNNELSPVTRR